MAHTAHTDPEQIKEHYDNKVILDPKIDQLVEWIKSSKRMIIFTGAGISTSAGIPDFRGPQGVWTLQAQGKARTEPTTSTIEAIPTACHMAIVTLQNLGILQYLISQNCDGLHRRSGMKADKMSELHGNGNVEECEDCGKRYFRDWSAYRIGRGRDHFTGYFCSQPGCRGRLMEWTIDFGQNLPQDQLERAYDQSSAGDLHLVLGSSLTVSPANSMPKRTKKNGGKLVICNLQKTPYYDLADINIHAPCDYVMSEVLKRMGIKPEIWELRRKIVVGVRFRQDPDNPGACDAFQLAVNGVDPDNDNVAATFFKKIQYVLPGEKKYIDLMGEWIPITPNVQKKPVITLRLHPVGHYHEPPLDITHPLILNGKESNDVYLLSYTPTTKKEWVIQRLLEVNIPPVTLISAYPRLSCTNILTQANKVGSLWSDGVAVGQSCMITFGGSKLSSGSPYPKIELYDIFNQSWDTIAQQDAGHLPFIFKERWGHSATYVPELNTVYLIGGWDGNSQYNDVHAFDLNTQTLRALTTKGKGPSHRAGHSAVACGKKIVVYGGAVCEGGPYKYFRDVYYFDCKTLEWVELQCSSLGQKPTPTAQHSATILWGRYMIVIGGYDGEWLRNNVYCLDLKLKQWNPVDMMGNPPPVGHHPQTKFRVPPFRHSCFLLNDDVILYYGVTGVYFIDTKTWHWVTVPGKFPLTGGHCGVQILPNEFLLWGGVDPDGNDDLNLRSLKLTYNC